MQIGKFTDPGFDDLMKRGQWILPPKYIPGLNKAAIRTIPLMSIRAGIGYLLLLLAHPVRQAIPEPFGATSYDAGERMFSGSTERPSPWFPPGAVATGASSYPNRAPQQSNAPWAFPENPHVSSLKSKPKQLYRTVVRGWTPFSFELVARKYNVGDHNYADKLRFCYNVITGLIPISS